LLSALTGEAWNSLYRSTEKAPKTRVKNLATAGKACR
jgi:hypothetical protein